MIKISTGPKALRRGFSKYRAKRVDFDGYSFSSQLEAALYVLLKAREQAGEISDLKNQVSCYLTKARILYKPDYSFIDNTTGILTFAESKGVETASWRIKRKLWQYYGDGPLLVYKGTHKRLYLSETIEVKSS